MHTKLFQDPSITFTCTVLYCAVMYWTALYCTLLDCTEIDHSVLNCTGQTPACSWSGGGGVVKSRGISRRWASYSRRTPNTAPCTLHTEHCTLLTAQCTLHIRVITEDFLDIIRQQFSGNSWGKSRTFVMWPWCARRINGYSLTELYLVQAAHFSAPFYRR